MNKQDMNNQEILEYCASQDPDLVYLAVGCSQAHWESDDTHASPQGHPPPIVALGGRQICILVDPTLENPPRCCRDQTPTDAQMIHEGSTTFITLHRNFDWEYNDQPLIEELCRRAISTKMRFIAQDYAGHIIDAYYPIRQFGPDLLKKVLFDFTYMDGGCFINFDNVRIMLRPDGSFVQPIYETLAAVMPFITESQLRFIVPKRTSTMYCYVKRLHSIQAGTEEERQWCTPFEVRKLIAPLAEIYGTSLSTSNANLAELMSRYLLDMSAAVGDPITKDDAMELATKPGKEYQMVLELLKGVLVQNVPLH